MAQVRRASHNKNNELLDPATRAGWVDGLSHLPAKLRAEGISEPHIDRSSTLIGNSRSHGKRVQARRNGNLHVVNTASLEVGNSREGQDTDERQLKDANRGPLNSPLGTVHYFSAPVGEDGNWMPSDLQSLQLSSTEICTNAVGGHTIKHFWAMYSYVAGRLKIRWGSSRCMRKSTVVRSESASFYRTTPYARQDGSSSHLSNRILRRVLASSCFPSVVEALPPWG